MKIEWDILVSLEGSELSMEAKTSNGRKFLRENADMISLGPDEFQRRIPEKLRVGYTSPRTEKIYDMRHGLQ